MPFRTLKLDHIGIAVKNPEEVLRFYQSMLGLNHSGTEVVADQKVRTTFLKLKDVNIELLEPIADDSPIQKFLASGRSGIHHLSFQVDDLEGALAALAASGVKLIDSKPRIGAHNKKIGFIHPSSTGGVLIELCEA